MRKKVNVLTLKKVVLLSTLCVVLGCKKNALQATEGSLGKGADSKNLAVMTTGTPISTVDVSLSGSEKYVLRVGGVPYYMTNIQVRIDKLRYWSTYGWTWAQCEALVAQAASDGFNTVSLPIHWYEVEPTKDNFDWTILDTYLGYCNTYNLKMEMLWFGANSGGHAQPLGDASSSVNHLRVPDYVLYSPDANGQSPATTSDYTIDRTYGNYTLNITDVNLRARETYVLGQVMAHIASWDAAHSSKHPVIGVQLNNEFRGGSHDSGTNDITYLSAIGSAVKNSAYSVWTRVNNIHDQPTLTAKINANESLRSGAGTNVDFIGIDDYSNAPDDMESVMPTIGKNFKMIMENDGHNTGRLKLASLAGDTQLDTYNMCGPDNNNLYDQTTMGSYAPHGSYVNEVRTINHMIQTDPVDLALYANRKNLFVHNWKANSTSPSTGGTLSITYTPTTSTDIGISIKRSATEAVLMSVQGGTFTYASSLAVTGASQGYFDASNTWVNQGAVSYTSTSVAVGAGKAVRLTYTGTSGGTGGSSPAPTIVGVGAAAASTGTITPSLPSGLQSNDILLLFVETANQAASISNQNGGTWAVVTGSGAGTGTAGGTDGARLTVFWSRYNGTQGAPTVDDSGDHQLATMMAIRGAVATGNPWEVVKTDIDTYTDNGGWSTGGTTTRNNDLVVIGDAGALANTTGTNNYNYWSNGDLASFSEVIDNSTVVGNGGSIGVAAGVLITAGTYSNSTDNHAVATKKSLVGIAIRPL